jgi:hypothetical protein
MNDVSQFDDHALEAARYGAMSKPHPRDAWPEKDERRREFEEDFRPLGKAMVGSSLVMGR